MDESQTHDGRAPDTQPAAAAESRRRSDVETSAKRVEAGAADWRADPAALPKDAFVPVVGLAGSPGSVDALQAFFEAVPTHSGMAFLVLVAGPDRNDGHGLVSTLRRATSMPVDAVDGPAMPVPNRVHVVPPGTTLSSDDGHPVGVDGLSARGGGIAVDLFLRSLADLYGARAAAVVLSGSEDDGAIGIRRIKERGGLTLAQDPREATHARMPQAAIATGLVDWVLPAAEMPARIAVCQGLLGRVDLPPEDSARPVRTEGRPADDREATLRDLLAFVQAKTGHDFGDYKRATIVRRVGRRMTLHGEPNLARYVDFLRAHPGECSALLRDLLASVSNFFRDAEAFRALEAEVPALFDGKSATDEVRVWVAGCATGEEAYSIAILLAEHAGRLQGAPTLRIFATDVAPDALRIARDAVYPAAIAADVSEERLRRFFVAEPSGYRIRDEIRASVVFSLHDVLKDAPFSQVDLFSCRNLLVFLDDAAQAGALDIAHFALRANGRLFLGTFETAAAAEPLFAAVDASHRIYRPREVDPRRPATPWDRSVQARNEELQAMNEELRSATEEIETSREELQSINEELTAVNRRLEQKIDALDHANADLQNLMNAAAIATVFLDRSLRITLFTPSAARLFNVIETDIGRPLADLAGRIDYPEVVDDVSGVLERLVPVQRELRFDSRWLMVRVLPYRSSDDHIAGVVLTFVDITERRQIEDALRDSEARFRTIVGQAAAGVVHTDLSARITLANARFAQIVGRSPEALTGLSLFELVDPADRLQAVDNFRRMVDEASSFETEARLVRSGGDPVWVSAAVTAIDDGRGTPASAVAIVLDITRRRESQAQLRASEERLRLVLESAREYAIVALDLERRIESWNVGAEQLTGYGEEEVRGRSGDIIFVEEDIASGAPVREARTALAEGRAADERWHRRKDGSRFWGSGVMMTMRSGETGAPIGLLKVFRDETRARVAKEALEQSRVELTRALAETHQARAEAEAASHAKDRFLAVLSHELRTPLTPVVMALYALERLSGLPDPARGMLEVVRRNVRAELHLIDDLLDVTRISTGKFEMASDRIDLHEVARAAADVCESDFVHKRQRFEIDLAASRHTRVGDPSRLQQAVWNLLKNAAKFTPAEGEIRLETESFGNRFVMRVTDTGIGIEAAALETVFDAFIQEAEWVTSEFGGLGLGLAIAKSTVEAHGGRLTASSPGRNRGATFTIELPLE